MWVFKLLSWKHSGWILRVSELLLVGLSFFSAYYITNLLPQLDFAFTFDYVIMLALVIPTWAILLKTSNIARMPRVRNVMSIFFDYLNISLIGFLLIFTYKHLFGLETFSHYVLLGFTALNLLALFTFRIITYKFYQKYRASGHNKHNLILVADDDSEAIIESIENHPEWGYRITIIFTDAENIRKKYFGKYKILPERGNIAEVIKYDIVDEVLYCKKEFNIEKIGKLNMSCKELGVIFRLRSKVSPVHFSNAQLVKLDNEPFLTFMNTPNHSLGWIWKSVSDFMIAAALIFFLSPVFITVALIIRATSKGPAIFKQRRVGLRGRQFYIYKFRTMVQNAEELKKKLMEQNESDGPAFKIKKDPRITPIGRFLRATSIDELPQLFNVLQGEMSLIGPRPPLPDEVAQYERWQLRRLSVKPGITCTWQIIPNRNDVVFDRWMKLDIQYIENWSFSSDLALFFKTVRSVFTDRGV